jgi:hypothetical protein
MRKGDFSKFNTTNHYNYKEMEIAVTWDYLNDRWTYSSSTHSVGGVFYGNIADLKNHIKYEYNHQ